MGLAVRKPLSHLEKNILMVQKTIKQVETMEAAMLSGQVKQEQAQLKEISKKSKSQEKLRTLEALSHAQGGRKLLDLEREENWHKEHEQQVAEAAEEANTAEAIANTQA